MYGASGIGWSDWLSRRLQGGIAWRERDATDDRHVVLSLDPLIRAGQEFD